MNVNANVRSNLVPKSSLPRTRYDMGVVRVLDSLTHGKLTPFFCQMVYPNETWQMDMSILCQADTSKVPPLDHIYHDTYWFFTPIRIIDPDFKKVLGDKDPYDDDEYGFPQIELDLTASEAYDFFNTNGSFDTDNLLMHLGYNIVYDSQIDAFKESITAYPLMAFWMIWNEFFRSEILDPIVDLSAYLNTPLTDLTASVFKCPSVNKYHDYFTNAFTSPMRGDEPTINLNQFVPVGVVPTANATLTGTGYPQISSGTVVEEGKLTQFFGALSGTGQTPPVVADLSSAGMTINQLRLAWQLTALYERKQIYGTRYWEVLNGQWGITVPDSMLDRPEYLGGSRETLSMYPVLNQANDLGNMAGQSKTILKGGSFTYSSHEFGILLGLSCTRVRHIYSQGKDPMLFGLKTELDLYNPLFANIGLTGIKNSEIYNAPYMANNGEVFGYTEAWSRLRSIPDRASGIFNPNASGTGRADFRDKWSYQDLYNGCPVLSAQWLKEPVLNVSRTLTGRLIPGSPATKVDEEIVEGTDQFLMGFYLHPIVTRVLPAHSIPVELTGSL